MAALNYEDALEKVARWASQPPSDDDIIEFCEAAIEDLKQPENVATFEKEIEDIGTAAIKVDSAFDTVNRSLKDFVDRFGSDFPELRAQQIQWESYKTNWTTLLWNSRDLATKTSASYAEYDQIFLELVESIKTKDDMLEAIELLKEFSKEKPTNIPEDFAQKFLTLSRDVQEFQKNFNAYVDDKGTELIAEAEKLQGEIADLKVEIEHLNTQINEGLKSLAISSLYGLVGLAIQGTFLIIYANNRSKKKKALANKEDELVEVNRKQAGLAFIRSQFDGLVPQFELICETLNVFANIWAGFHSEALQFAVTLQGLIDIGESEIPKSWVLRIKLAREVAAPIQASLDAYARQISRSASLSQDS